MMDDTITTLLRGVADGSIPVADARTALEGAELEEMSTAIDHGVFNAAEPGTIVSASLAPGCILPHLFFLAWGLFWICYWSFSMIYGLAKGWDQQQLSFHLAMTMTTVIMIGIIYLKYILPDTIKHAQNKFIPEHQKDWREYKW